MMKEKGKVKRNIKERKQNTKCDISDKEKFEKNRENNLKSITEKGQKAADDIREYQKAINDKQQELESVNAEIAKFEETLKEKKEVVDSIRAVADMSKNAEYQKISEQILSLENEIEEMSKETVGKTELEAKKLFCVMKSQILLRKLNLRTIQRLKSVLQSWKKRKRKSDRRSRSRNE